MTPELLERVDDYGASHRNPVNRAMRVRGIPLLGTATLGLLARVPARPAPNAAWAALAGAAAWYLRLDPRSGPCCLWGPLGTEAGCYAAGRRLPPRALAGMWAAGAACHLIGHYGFEGKPPAALSDPAAVLKAPAWLVWLLGGAAREATPAAEPLTTRSGSD